MTQEKILQLEKKLQKIQAVEVAPPKPEDHILGGLGGEVFEEINPTGKWIKFLPEKEVQYNNLIDFMNCVTQSGNNIQEILDRFKYGIKSNYADRWSAKKNGTTRNGNSTSNYADSIRKGHDGLIPEEKYPWTPNMTWDEFYKQTPEELDEEGREWANEYDPKYKTFSKSNFKEAFKISPQHWAVKAWYQDSNGMYISPTNANHNHAVCGIGHYTKEDLEQVKDILEKYDSYIPANMKSGVEHPVCFDSYPPFIKVLTPDYDIYGYAKCYKTNKKKEEIILPTNNDMINLIKFKTDPKIYLQDSISPENLSWVGNENTLLTFWRRGWLNVKARTEQELWKEIETNALDDSLRANYDIQNGTILINYFLNSLINFLGSDKEGTDLIK